MNFSIFVTQKEEKIEKQSLCPYSSSQTKVVYTQSGCPLGVHKMLWKKISKKFSFWRYAKKPDYFIQTLKIHKKFSWRSKLDFFFRMYSLCIEVSSDEKKREYSCVGDQILVIKVYYYTTTTTCVFVEIYCCISHELCPIYFGRQNTNSLQLQGLFLNDVMFMGEVGQNMTSIAYLFSFNHDNGFLFIL